MIQESDFNFNGKINLNGLERIMNNEVAVFIEDSKKSISEIKENCIGDSGKLE